MSHLWSHNSSINKVRSYRTLHYPTRGRIMYRFNPVWSDSNIRHLQIVNKTSLQMECKNCNINVNWFHVRAVEETKCWLTLSFSCCCVFPFYVAAGVLNPDVYTPRRFRRLPRENDITVRNMEEIYRYYFRFRIRNA